MSIKKSWTAFINIIGKFIPCPTTSMRRMTKNVMANLIEAAKEFTTMTVNVVKSLIEIHYHRKKKQMSNKSNKTFKNSVTIVVKFSQLTYLILIG